MINKEKKNICENCLNNRHNFCYLVTHCDCPTCHQPKEVSKKKDMITEMFEAMGIKVVDVTPIQSVERKEERVCIQNDGQSCREDLNGDCYYCGKSMLTKNNWEENYPIPDKEEWEEYSFKGENPEKCDMICDHDIQWCGDSYACSNCGLRFIPAKWANKKLSQAQSEHNQDCTREEWARASERERILKGIEKMKIEGIPKHREVRDTYNQALEDIINLINKDNER